MNERIREAQMSGGKAHAPELLSDCLSLRFHYESEQFANLQIT